MNYQFFATCPRGLEALLVDELTHNKAHKIVATDGGVSFEGNLETMYRVNLHSRIATRVLSRVSQGTYTLKKIFIKLRLNSSGPHGLK